ncbi:MAG TPA: AarF/ABC1/UbiB kinase family protein [Chloroflexota bacterium]|nr:AarF/ABC1/UbiB kinase family protein [Chloroflexota bacterium]
MAVRHGLLPPPNTRAWRRTRRRRFRAVVVLFTSFILDYWRLWIFRHILGEAFVRRRLPALRRQQGVRYRETAIQQGGLLIKLGQFFSSRVDLLPPEYIEELAKLQDEVPPIPFAQIRAVAERELGGPLDTWYTSVDQQAVAAASLGQVHRATLPTGEQVAVKVQRPEIAAIVAIDLDNLRWVISWMRRLTKLAGDVDWNGVLAEFTETLGDELDYRIEAASAERFRRTFAGNANVYAPLIYPTHSRERVLTMEFCDGIKITNYAALEAAGISRTAVARTLLETYFRQIFEMDFFHADPHPGNLLVRPGPVLVFLDFGLMGHITPAVRAGARNLLNAMVGRDADLATRTLADMGFLRRGANVRTVRDALAWFLDQFYRNSLAELAHISPHEVFAQVKDLIYEQPFQIPANYVFVGRAIGTLVGLSTGLAPNLNVIQIMTPYARTLAGRDDAVDILELAAKHAREYGRIALDLPRVLDRVLTRIDTGSLQLRVEDVDEMTRHIIRLERTGRRLVSAALCVGLLLSGSVLIGQAHEVRGDVAFVLAVILGVISIWPGSARSARR